MLTGEPIGRIRREHFLKGKAIKEIVRDLKVSRNTVRKILRSGETAFAYGRRVQPRPKLGPWIGSRRAASNQRSQVVARAIDADPAVRGAAGTWI